MNIDKLLQREPSDVFNEIKCPCCGRGTLDWHYICDCGWEYDGITDEDEYSSANQMTIREYRKRLER